MREYIDQVGCHGIKTEEVFIARLTRALVARFHLSHKLGRNNIAIHKSLEEEQR
jgi:hypothetical protein